MKDIIEESFSINLCVMKNLGLYAPEKHKVLYKIKACLMYLIFIVITSVLVAIFILTQEDRDITKLNFSGIFLAETICFIPKLIPFLTNDSKMKSCINYFRHPYYVPEEEEQKNIIEECNRICRRNSMAYIIIVTFGELTWNLKPLFLDGEKMPLNVWLPFDPNISPMTFWSTYLFLAAASAYNGFAGTLVDPLIGGLACQAAGQLKILKFNIQRLNEHTKNEETLYSKIRKCIIHYNTVLNFVKIYEECFSWVVFSQFASSVFGICFCCLQLSMVPTMSFTALFCFTYILIIVAQIYFYCYYGTELFEENNTLTDAIYMGPWYEYDFSSQKALIILMERSKKPMIVTAGKLVYLTVDTFTLILKRSYSLICVLKT